ncbi:hypothetical protein H9P43_009629 [Blastocladiella emersonii ATCC 22665]|nr:hypothetical protein H9P43_009629 [Blastocladiella emersonii ATCC 22665]
MDPSSSATPTSATRHGYRCPKCRTVLFTSDHLVPHSVETDGGDASWRFRGKSSSVVQDATLVGYTPDSEVCTVLNITPPKWMAGELDEGNVQGKITCPVTLKTGKPCGTKFGEYHWQGTTCSCGTWVAPAFLVPRSRVDRIVLPPAQAQPAAVENKESS